MFSILFHISYGYNAKIAYPDDGIQYGDTCMSQTLKKDMVGEIAYTLTIEGHVVEEVTGDDPVEYLHGAKTSFQAWKKRLKARPRATSSA
jgi:hypothetical protein